MLKRWWLASIWEIGLSRPFRGDGLSTRHLKTPLPCYSLQIVLMAFCFGVPPTSLSADFGEPINEPSQVVFDYRWEGEMLESDFEEPSGLVFDPRRECLFVVGDEGDIAQIGLDGEVARKRHVADADFEGITIVPDQDRLYIAVEGDEVILEIHPKSFEILRRFHLERERGDETLFPADGDGIEGITFVPDAEHPEGGVFLVTNQSFSLEDEPSLVVEVALPLSKAQNSPASVTPVRGTSPGVIDLSALHYHAGSESFFIVSDATNTLMEMDRQHEMQRIWTFPGNDQEGITFDASGYLYIAQDSGGIVKIWPRTLHSKEQEN